MANQAGKNCTELLEQIRLLSERETELIARAETEEIWHIRREREGLTKQVARCWSELGGEATDLEPQLAEMARMAAAIRAVDRENMERLAEMKGDAASRLEQLSDGRQAVQGYRVPSGETPAYIDRRG